jgi:hypothetical protein
MDGSVKVVRVFVLFSAMVLLTGDPAVVSRAPAFPHNSVQAQASQASSSPNATHTRTSSQATEREAKGEGCWREWDARRAESEDEDERERRRWVVWSVLKWLDV